MRLDRRGFLAGLPLLGFLAPLLKPLAPRPVLSAASLPEDTVITIGPEELARYREQWTLTTTPGDIHWYSAHPLRRGEIVFLNGRYLVNPTTPDAD